LVPDEPDNACLHQCGKCTQTVSEEDTPRRGDEESPSGITNKLTSRRPKKQGVLVSLSGYIFFVDFHSKNKYPDMLPSNSLFFTHPISYVRQYVQVYKLHTQAVSAETAEKRARQIDEARKRREYLRAHDMEQPGLFGFGTVEQEEAAEKRKVREEEKKTIYNEKRIYEEMMKRRAMELGVGDVEAAPVPAASEKRVYLDFEGKPVPVKKWFGIW